MSTTPETPTPETDLEVAKHCHGSTMHAHCLNSSHLSGDFANFARRLERERDAARTEIEAMREAIREAHTTLKGIAMAKPSEWGEMSDQFKPWSQNRARHALTKLQPFITLEA